MTRFTISTLIALLIVFAVPSFSEAYSTHAQNAARITENSAIYTISYRFGMPQRDFYLPIFAERDLRKAEYEKLTLGYEFLEDGKLYTDRGQSAGIVLSNAEVIDGKYFVPAGKFATFTLMVVLATDVDAAEMDYALHVTSLPFVGITADQEVLQQKLTGGELKHYTTAEIELNESNGD